MLRGRRRIAEESGGWENRANFVVLPSKMGGIGADMRAERALGAPRSCEWVPRLCNGLMEGSMPSFFDVVDCTSPDMVPLYDRLVASGRTTVLCYERMSNAVVQMGNDILRMAGPRGAHVVRIWGHGLPGIVPIATGLTPEGVTLHHAGLGIRRDFDTNTYFNTAVPEKLKPLAQALNPTARLELHGCSIAAGRVGDQLCRELAKQLACWVYASTVYQYELEWVPPVLAFPPGGKTVVNNAKPPPLTW